MEKKEKYKLFSFTKQQKCKIAKTKISYNQWFWFYAPPPLPYTQN